MIQKPIGTPEDELQITFRIHHQTKSSSAGLFTLVKGE
jgi:hypothetical protein